MHPGYDHTFKVRIANINGHPSKFTQMETVLSPNPVAAAAQSGGSSHLGGETLAAIIVPCVLVVIALVLVLTIFAVRHVRLQNSFRSFANSHYDTRSGTATFSSSDDLEEEEQPMIRGFSDDEPLVIA
ncbi:hypothetical protein NP493_3608g00002 [Ridgeia piscesae]|nr:hypothetical protein NP493_3608g00002 [Ridgeia piscesae]